MALEEYVGSIVLYVDGQEIEVTDIRPQTNTGRKLVKTMNRTGRAKGFAKGIAEHQLQITVVMPKNVAQPDWDEMEGAKLTTMDNGTVAASYSTAGAAGNTTAITTGTFTSTPTGFDSTVIIGIMSGGTDQESDTELLDRLLDIIRRAPAGGNKYDYRRWAMSVDGVTAAYVYPLRRGLGTVDVVITSADGLPSAEIIAATQAYIDDVRPVTAKNCLVLGPTIKTIDLVIQVSLDGVAIDVARENIISALTDYINKLPPGEPFIRSQAEMLISIVTGVVDRVIVSPTSNVFPDVSETVVEWIRVGSIEVSQL